MPARSHGYSKTPTYSIWCEMWTRCTNKKRHNFKWYGGQGITVCERWKKFENFLADMGERHGKMTLDRKDSTKGYGPDNCRWADMVTQNNNKCSNRIMVIKGVSMTVSEAERAYSVKYRTLIGRLNRGWSGDDAVSAPVDSRFGSHQRKRS